MILDKLENCGLYESIHPAFKKAFDFLKTTDLLTLPLGKIELDGSNLFVNVVEIAGKTAEEARMETHIKYIDIQVPITATETMGWIPENDLKVITEPYNVDKDLAFFGDAAYNFLQVNPSEFAIFFPTDGHQPGIANGTVKKIIIKVLV
jgi:YhcH/YjgK/YiaL family protein